jgi:hypothetical protein
MLFRTISLFVLASSAHGFVFLNKKVASAELASLAKAPSGTILDLRLDVGSNDHSRMSLQGLHLELSQEEAVDKLRVKLPGADGPRTSFSSGARTIHVKDPAFFVSMAGKQNVPFNHGCWEMVWRENAPAGVIVCGFDLEESVQRNEAVLNKGRIFLSIPVWTKQGLKEQQERRREIEARVKLHQDAKKEAYDKMAETSNPIMKALHFRNAAEATEQLSYWYINQDRISQVPLDEDVLALRDDIFITTKGTVWTKGADNLFGGGQHSLLGTVTIRPYHDSTLP